MGEKEKFVTVSIPGELAERLKERIKGTGFHTLSSYVTYVLREIIHHSPEIKGQKEAFTKEEEAKVKERLKSLDYLD